MSTTAEPVRYCTSCGVDMTPDDGDWITCPNAPDICIDCCADNH